MLSDPLMADCGFPALGTSGANREVQCREGVAVVGMIPLAYQKANRESDKEPPMPSMCRASHSLRLVLVSALSPFIQRTVDRLRR
jgi:hypothetical protein